MLGRARKRKHSKFVNARCEFDSRGASSGENSLEGTIVIPQLTKVTEGFPVLTRNCKKNFYLRAGNRVVGIRGYSCSRTDHRETELIKYKPAGRSNREFRRFVAPREREELF